ncbi:sigma 54-interacting transcriptional regulator [Sorangium sp. So ce291]|uniref:sigma 54-interacting transcriptional regulator n=1 Tax=Sorangium sp. So ce291 TaxID=3133294 RepID=UPI003F62BF4E
MGEDRPVRVEVALIAATNRSLEAMVERGAFRRDLLARFLVRIDLAPLRERPEDVFAVLQALRERRGAPFDPRAAEVEAVERLLLERWPANVRDVVRLVAVDGREQEVAVHLVEARGDARGAGLGGEGPGRDRGEGLLDDEEDGKRLALRGGELASPGAAQDGLAQGPWVQQAEPPQPCVPQQEQGGQPRYNGRQRREERQRHRPAMPDQEERPERGAGEHEDRERRAAHRGSPFAPKIRRFAACTNAYACSGVRRAGP